LNNVTGKVEKIVNMLNMTLMGGSEAVMRGTTVLPQWIGAKKFAADVIDQNLPVVLAKGVAVGGAAAKLCDDYINLATRIHFGN
jgi:hypothetical protein